MIARATALVPPALLLATAALAGTAPAVLLVGDSWAEQMYTDGALGTALTTAGHPEVAVLGANTAISGSTAEEWAQATMLTLLTDELAAHPETEAVVLFLGGNDFLEGESGGGWYVGISPAAETALFDDIEADLAVVIDAILAADPDVEVILSSYDYPNFVESLGGIVGFFVCRPLWQDLGEPTPLEINSATGLLDVRHATLASSRPRVRVVAHWGLMQNVFGYPSMEIDPGDLPLPGDPTLPSPPEAMRPQLADIDCFHLRASGYEALAGRLWDEALRRTLDGLFFDGFEDGLGAWSSVVQ